MVEMVELERIENSRVLEYNPASQVGVAYSRTLWYGDDWMSVVESSKMSGLNRHTQNRWYRWSTTSWNKIYLNKAGKFCTRRKSGKAFYGDPDFLAFGSDKVSPFVQSVFDKPFNMNTMFPMNTQFGDGLFGYGRIPRTLVPAFKAENPAEFVVIAFGKSRYRKDLVKAVANSNNPDAIALAQAFRGLVPIDWIIDFINNSPDGMRGPRLGNIRPFLFQLDPRSYRAMLRAPLTNRDLNAMADMTTPDVRFARFQPAAGRVKTFYELHDLTTVHVNYGQWRAAGGTTTAIEQRTDIPQTDLAKAIDGQMLDKGYRIVIPKEAGELSEWSKFMHNCIGGYTYQVCRDNADSTLGGIYQGNELVANFEVQGTQLKQLLGKFNRNLAGEQQKMLENFFKAFGISAGYYWGQG